MRSLRSMRGVWSTSELGGDDDEGSLAFWKLDATEDHARRRRRLRRNLAFDSHEEASAEVRADAERASVYALTAAAVGGSGGAGEGADGASGHEDERHG